MTARFRDGRWTADFYFGDERIRRVSPQNSKSGAERYERMLRARLERGQPLDEDGSTDQPTTATRSRSGVPTFKEFSEIFMATYATQNSDAERASKQSHLDAHLLPALGRKRLDAIDLFTIDTLKAKLLTEKSRRGRPRSPKTVNNILATLNKLLGYACKIGVLDAKPELIMLKVDEVAPVFLDFAPYEKLVSAAASEPLWHAAILLGGDAGLRLGEIRAVRRPHCHGDRIRVQRAFWRDVEKGTKGKRLRTVPMSERLQAALTRLAGRDHEYLISTSATDALTLEEARWHLPRLCERAGIGPIGWHVLRHTYCSHLAMAGVPVRVIQELAGHQDLQTTLKYMHVTPGAADLAVQVLTEHRNRVQSVNLGTDFGQIDDPEG